jgi:ribonucleoside-diphosphate reductase beta chain
MSLLKPRVVYAPFEYERAYEFWLTQQQSHWLHTKANLSKDILDWKFNLTESEKHLIGFILKGFTQSEVFIQDYWACNVSRWFKKPEIQMMSSSFAAMESIHAVSYAYLNQTLGLEDFSAFLHEPTAKAKIDRLMMVKGKSKKDIARSLAIFSAFNEGVNLFSSFAILFNFSRFKKMKGLTDIIKWSALDEALHSQAGCWLFNTLIEENPEIWDDELKKDIYDAARITIELEDHFIEKAFELGDVQGINKAGMKNFIRDRCNSKLQSIGLKKNWKNIDQKLLEEMSWFYMFVFGNKSDDFFATRVTDYAKGTKDWSNICF